MPKPRKPRDPEAYVSPAEAAEALRKAAELVESREGERIKVTIDLRFWWPDESESRCLTAASTE